MIGFHFDDTEWDEKENCLREESLYNANDKIFERPNHDKVLVYSGKTGWSMEDKREEELMKVTCIEHPTEQDWIACKERALVTVGLKVKNAPTEEWKKAILKARHSPIRKLSFSFYLEDVPTWVMTHLVRHVHAQPYVLSQRNDRQDNYDREKAPQDAPVKAIWDMNAEELMVIMNKRLCKQASEKTRNLVQMMRDEVLKTNPEFEPFLVPMCKYVGECKEMYPCYEK